jgi:hypothetical protein
MVTSKPFLRLSIHASSLTHSLRNGSPRCIVRFSSSCETQPGSMPRRSFTAILKCCLQPMYRSVVCTETCPRKNWICSSSPPASWQSRAHERRRSCGANRGISRLMAAFLTTCHTVFSETPWPQSLPARQTHRNNGPLLMPAAANHASRVTFTQFGTGTVRMCFPLPTRSTMAQRSSRRCKLSNVSSASSRRRSPQPSKIANVARLRFPVRVWPSGDCQKANASFAVNQLPKREPSLRTPLTRWMPAASSGGSTDQSLLPHKQADAQRPCAR